MFRKNLKFTLISALTLTITLSFPLHVKAQTFASRFINMGKTFHEGDYKKALALSEELKAPSSYEGHVLYVKALSQENLGNKKDAAKTLEKLITNCKDSETYEAAKARLFSININQAKNTSDLASLEQTAKSMSSSSARANAYERMSKLSFLTNGRRSRFAMSALKEYFKGRRFRQPPQAAKSILSEIIQNPEKYTFLTREWQDIAVYALSAGVLDEFPKNHRKLAKKNIGSDLFALLEAARATKDDKIENALELCNEVLKSSTAEAGEKNIAARLKAEALYKTRKYTEALEAYEKTVNMKKWPGDELDTTLMLFKCVYKQKKDAETLKTANELYKSKIAPYNLAALLYEFGLEAFDDGDKERAMPYFLTLIRMFPSNHRADDAAGYAIMSTKPGETPDKSLKDFLERKFPTSFFLWWIFPENREKKLGSTNAQPTGKLTKGMLISLERAELMGKGGFLAHSSSIMNRLSNSFPANETLFKAMIDLAEETNNFSMLVTLGDRFARQSAEKGKNLEDLPKWALKAMYPLAYNDSVEKYSKEFGVDKYWILSIMREESHYNPAVLSSSNAMGLMQILPSTGKWIAEQLNVKKFKTSDIWDTDLNIRFGTWYLDYLTKYFDGEIFLATAAYNGGQGAIKRRLLNTPNSKLPLLEMMDKVPMSETRDYYKKVMGTYWNYKRIY